MALELPIFNYHPNLLESGSVEASDQRCLCCNQNQGYIYTGPITADEDLLDKICPWCIQNGSANRKFKAIFTNPKEIRGFQKKEDLPPHVIEEISQRTPGFYGWQESKWWAHCGDAAVFRGVIGAEEIENLGKKVIKALRDYFPEKTPQEFMDYLSELSRDNSPSAYLFECRICSEYGIYGDEEEQAPE